MSRQSVYEGLKTALKYRGLPCHHFEDATCTIAFESWESFNLFDRLLDSIPMPDNVKLNIYAKRVGDRSDGVAVTVSDEVQHLGYWNMYFDMREKVAAFESTISALLRSGIQLLHYDYGNFSINIRHQDFNLLPPMKTPFSATIRERDNGSRYYTIWLDFLT
jgi:hypothetical protein